MLGDTIGSEVKVIVGELLVTISDEDKVRAEEIGQTYHLRTRKQKI